MHNSSPDKHICGRVDCQRLWFVRNAFPRFRLKMTKIDNFSRAARSSANEGRFGNLDRFLESPDDALS